MHKSVLENTGVSDALFCPMGPRVLVEVPEEDIKSEDPNDPKNILPDGRRVLSRGNKSTKLFKGETLEKEEKEKERFYKVVAISPDIAKLETIEPGDYIAMGSMAYPVVDVKGKEYGIIDYHRILGIFSHEAIHYKKEKQYE